MDADGAQAHVLADGAPVARIRAGAGTGSRSQAALTTETQSDARDPRRAQPIAFTSEYSIDPAWSPNGRLWSIPATMSDDLSAARATQMAIV